MGHVTGPLSRVMDVPVVLTLFSVLNYVFLISAFRHTRGEARMVLLMQFMDLGNIPLFSALCEQALCEQPDNDFCQTHFVRHARLSFVGSAHVWIKTSLLAMTWSRATHLERFNIVVPLLLTMGSKSYSTLQVETAFMASESLSFSNFFSLSPLAAIFMAALAIPGLVVLACAARLAGIVFCPCHYLNITSGCVPCVC